MNLLFFTPAKGDGSLYYYIGDTIQDANIINAGSVINDVNNLKRNTLNTFQITNCITEIPQDINLELKDGVLTLKAGSKVYVPNGFEADGTTPKFDEVVIAKDYIVPTDGQTGTGSILYYDKDLDITAWRWLTECFSQTNQPTSSQFMLWYDTANNIIKSTFDTGATWTECSLTLGVFTINNGTVTSIDQVFNGFGYIGSTVFVTKGVKGLIPNGRNEDGTLNNIEYTNDKVLTATWSSHSWQSSSQKPIIVWRGSEWQLHGSQETTGIVTDNTNYFYWDKYSNKTYWHLDNEIYDKVLVIGGVVGINFNPKLPFRVVDYSDKPTVSGWTMPSNKYIDLTVGASASTYTAPANGYFYFYAIVKVDNCTLLLDNLSTQGLRSHIRVPKATADGSVFMLAKKGDTIQIAYDNSLQKSTLRFIYAEGEI